MSNINETRVAKIQIRRGMRKDLPNPLSPGEFGLCTDTNELFIGSDTSSILGGLSARTVQLDNALNVVALSTSVLNDQIIEFVVKRDIITGDGNAIAFGITSVESGVAETWPIVTRHREITREVTVLTPANALATPQIVLSDEPNGIAHAHYRLNPAFGSSSVTFSSYEIPTLTDTVYVVHYRESDFIDDLVERFNAVENTDAAGYTQLIAVSSIATAGSSYVNGDVLTVSGGTSSVTAEITVTGVSSGEITSAVISEKGNYSVLPSNPVSVTGGTGSGATFNLSSATVSYQLTTSQIYFDDSTGRGFIGLAEHQSSDTITLTSGSTTIKSALEAYINRLDNVINAKTVSGLGIHTMKSEIPGYLYATNVNTAGTNYAVGDVLTLVGGTGTAATLEVSSVDAIATGVITGLSVSSLGNYSVNPGSTAVATSTPANFHASAASLVGAGGTYTALDELTIEGGTVHVIDVAVANGGSGYAVNDRLTASAGTFSTAVEVLVTSINVGAVTGIQITISGAYTVFPTTSSATTSDGSGSGCTLDLTSSATVIRVLTLAGGQSVSTFTIITAGTYSVAPTGTLSTTYSGAGTGATFTLTTVSPSDTATVDILYSSDTTADVTQDFRDSNVEIGYTGSFVSDEINGFLVHSREYAIQVSSFLNDNYISDSGISVAQIAHLRTNVRLMSDAEFLEISSDSFISTPNTASLPQTSVAASLSTTDESATGITYSATSSGSVFIDYILTITDGATTFDISRIGRFALVFPNGTSGANLDGKAVILDTFAEVDLLGTTVTVEDPGDLTIPRIVFGAKVARYVATAAHATSPINAPLSDNEVTLLTLGIEYTWAEPSHQYLGFITYVNTFGQTANLRMTSSRYSLT